MTHYFFTLRLGTKSGLHRSLSIFSARFCSRPTFYPLSFLIPEELFEFQTAFSTEAPFILKPARGACGRGICVAAELPTSFVSPHVIAQKYITNPMLIRGYKFDLRFYVAVTSIDPLRVYTYNDGLVRLATEPYDLHRTDFAELTAHLTNFSVNRQSEAFQVTNDVLNDGQGSKWSHRPLWPFLSSSGFDCEKIKTEVDDLIATVLIAVCPELRKQKNHRCSFEMYAFDILLDENAGVHLLEVNVSPALGTSSKLDKFIKAPLVKDWLNLSLIPIADNDTMQMVLSVEKAFQGKNRNLAAFLAICELEIAETRCGGFRRVFPTKDRVKMTKWLDLTDLDQAVLQWVQFTKTEKKNYLEEHVDDFLELSEENLGCQTCLLF